MSQWWEMLFSRVAKHMIRFSVKNTCYKYYIDYLRLSFQSGCDRKMWEFNKPQQIVI